MNVEPAAKALLEKAAIQLQLSARSLIRVMRVGRTIADMARSETVRRIDVAEALSYRQRFPALPGKIL